jgi:hypothetical protein
MAPITTTGNIPDFCVVAGTAVAIDGTVVAGVPEVVSTAVECVVTGAVLVAVRILTCTDPMGGTTFTI